MFVCESNVFISDFFFIKMSLVGFCSGVLGEMCVYIDLDGNCLFYNI